MNKKDKLEELIIDNNGTITTSELSIYDIPRTYLAMMVAEGKLEKVSRGIYVAVDSIEDEMYALQSKYSHLIYSHETALFFHGLTDRTPDIYAATVPSGYKVVNNISNKCKIYYIKTDLHTLGKSSSYTAFGNLVSTYNIERTICDIVRSRSRIDIQIFNDALKQLPSLKSVDYSLMLSYAQALKIEKKLTDLLEIIL